MPKMSADDARRILTSRKLDTYDAALEARVAIDVARWGTDEREASLRMHAGLSHARLVNSIAHADAQSIDDELAAAADTLMSAADWRDLRKGG